MLVESTTKNNKPQQTATNALPLRMKRAEKIKAFPGGKPLISKSSIAISSGSAPVCKGHP